MLKQIFRLILYFFGSIFKTDNLSQKYPISIKAIISDQDRILCLRNDRGEWDLPGGKINSDEQPEFTLTREVKEETGLDISNLELLKAFNLKFNEVDVIVILYKATIESDDAVNISFEHNEYNFFTKEEFINLNINPEYSQLVRVYF